MSCSSVRIRVCVASVLLLAACAAAQNPTAKPEDSCRAYVQRFYHWYVPAVFDGRQSPASNRALLRKEFAFSAELRRRLKEDFEASSKNHDEIVGLDFDPFLNTQDPSRHYVVAKVDSASGRCRAEVHSVEAGKRSVKPDVAPELEQQDGRWVFVNFHYPQSQKPEDADLLAVLKTLREARQHSQ